MVDAIANLAYSTVAVPPSPGLTGTELQVQEGQGALFPAPPFDLTMWPAGVAPLASNCEIARVTASDGDAMTLDRAQYGTTAQDISVGYQVAQNITEALLAQIIAAGGGVGQTLSLTWGDNTFDVPVASLPAGWSGSGTASMLVQLTTGPDLVNGLEDQNGNPIPDGWSFPAIVFVEGSTIFDIVAVNPFFPGSGTLYAWDGPGPAVAAINFNGGIQVSDATGDSVTLQGGTATVTGAGSAVLVCGSHSLVADGNGIKVVNQGIAENYLFAYNGNPNGNVTAILAGDTCFTPSGPWYASAPGDSNWTQGSSTFPNQSGVGSPLGVVTPDFAGAWYQDTSSTDNPSLWQASGTTNTSWVCFGGGDPGAPAGIVLVGDTAVPGSEFGALIIQDDAGSVVQVGGGLGPNSAFLEAGDTDNGRALIVAATDGAGNGSVSLQVQNAGSPTYSLNLNENGLELVLQGVGEFYFQVSDVPPNGVVNALVAGSVCIVAPSSGPASVWQAQAPGTDNWTRLGGTAVTPTTGAYAMTGQEQVVVASGAATLPSPSIYAGIPFTIKDSGSGTASVLPNASETIDGQSSIPLSAYEAVTVTSDGTNWWVLSQVATSVL